VCGTPERDLSVERAETGPGVEQYEEGRQHLVVVGEDDAGRSAGRSPSVRVEPLALIDIVRAQLLESLAQRSLVERGNRREPVEMDLAVCVDHASFGEQSPVERHVPGGVRQEPPETLLLEGAQSVEIQPLQGLERPQLAFDPGEGQVSVDDQLPDENHDLLSRNSRP